MRHSQGDQWDLLVIAPMQSWTDYHSAASTKKRRDASAQHAELIAAGQALFAFYEDHFAHGPPWAIVESAYAANDFFHIEMFNAAPGKADELLEQRRDRPFESDQHRFGEVTSWLKFLATNTPHTQGGKEQSRDKPSQIKRRSSSSHFVRAHRV